MNTHRSFPSFAKHAVAFCFLLGLAACGVHRYVAVDPVNSHRIDEMTFQAQSDPKTLFGSENIFFIGDAGEPTLDTQEPIFEALEAQLRINPEHSTVVFLGDNVYPMGIPVEVGMERKLCERKLEEQIKVVERSGARGIFIPGNHDWHNGADDGLERLAMQERFIEGRKNPRIMLLPRAGCPGPVVVNVGSTVRLIVLDTQWWLHEGPKPIGASSPCSEKTEDDVLRELASAIRTAGGRSVIVVGHHPLESNGSHGGFFDWRAHIFPFRVLDKALWIPLPLIGSLHPFVRNLGAFPIDISHSSYRHFIKRIDSVFTLYSPTIYATGHEHNLQVLRHSSSFLHIISGCGTSYHDSPVSTGQNTLFADPDTGFMIFHTYPTRLLRVIQLSPEGSPEETYRLSLDALK